MHGNRIIRFAYVAPQRKDRQEQFHQHRDGAAFGELAFILHPLGFTYGGVVMNYPSEDLTKIIKVDHSFLRPSDLLVLNTRPPLDDMRTEEKRGMRPSGTTLERKVFAAVRPCFNVCSRSHVKLNSRLANRLPRGYENRGEIEYMQNLGASYKNLKRVNDLRWKKPDGERKTALFFIHIPKPSKWPGGPRILAVFGMEGNTSFIWAYLLRIRYWDELALKLNEPKFLMAEITTGVDRYRPYDLSFTDDWKVEVLLSETYPTP